MSRTSTGALLPVFLTLIASSGCGEDVAESEFQVYITLDDTELQFDGSQATTVSVQVLDQNNIPAAAGTRVVFFGRNLDSGNASGVFGEQAEETQFVFLDSTGSARTGFACTEEAELVIGAQEPGGAQGGVGMSCRDLFPGDWSIVEFGTERIQIRPGADTQITARAEQTDGSPIPTGIELLFDAGDGQGGFGSSAAQTRAVAVNSSGEAQVTYTAGGTTETVTLTVNFADSNAGNSPQSTSLVITNDAPEDAGLLLSAATNSVPADGFSEVSLSVIVFDAGFVPRANDTVTLSTDLGSLRLGANSGSQISGSSDTQGQVNAVFIAGATPGIATITATDSLNNSEEVLVSLISVGSVAFISADSLPLGVQGSGENESTEICFLVADTSGTPYPAGTTTAFEMTTTSDGAALTALSANTNADGQSCTTVISGTSFGTVQVNACVTVGTNTVCGSSDDLPVVGATPSRGGISISCNDRNIGALRYLSGGTISAPPEGDLCTECTVELLDRAGNRVGFERQVTFMAESGSFVPSSRTTNDVNGVATITWCAQGNAPADTDPVSGEPSWVPEANDDQNPIWNPRDGLVTIIAYVNGEEEFEDSNSNGRWDSGELFWDLPEPYVDADDNNDRNTLLDGSLEQFQDIDLAGHTSSFWDLENLAWDANTTIWVDTRIMLTGDPYFDVTDEISGVGPGAPDGLTFDVAYPDEPRLSHWYIQEAGAEFPSETLANRYQLEPDGIDGCEAGDEPHCVFLEDETGPLTVTLVLRDQFGNPMNRSLSNVAVAFPILACDLALTAEIETNLSPANDNNPFPNDATRLPNGSTSIERAYPYDIGGFDPRVGSWERWVITRFLILPVAGCKVEFQIPLQACPSCGDPSLIDDNVFVRFFIPE